LPTDFRVRSSGEKRFFWTLTPCGDGSTDKRCVDAGIFLLTRREASDIFVNTTSRSAKMCGRGREESTGGAGLNLTYFFVQN
jgi:hypothetical protein